MSRLVQTSFYIVHSARSTVECEHPHTPRQMPELVVEEAQGWLLRV